MNAELLFTEFQRLIEAPDAIPTWRRFILDLALRGRLVDQRPSDEAAALLLSSIRDHGSQILGKNWKPSRKYPVDQDGVPFAAPPQWEWIQFDAIHDLVRGVTYTKSDVADSPTPGYLPVLRANNIGATVNFDDLVYVKAHCVRVNQRLRRGDYLIALSSGSRNLVGKAAYVTQDYEAAFGGFCGAVRLALPSLAPYVGVFLASRLYRDAISAGSRGIGINNLRRDTLNSLLFPLPPLAEQHRIVAKIDELMTLCDQLEAAQAERERKRDQLATASLARLSEPEVETDTPDAGANFFATHFTHIIRRPDQISQLRSTILALAILGRLTEQYPTDEPAGEFLSRISAQRSSETPTLPSFALSAPRPNWAWTTLGAVSKRIHYGYTASANHALTDTRLLRITDIQNDAVNWSSVPGCEISPTEIAKYQLFPGDILVARTGGTIGKTFLVRDAPPRAVFASYLIRIIPLDEMDASYLKLFMASPLYWKQLGDVSRGTGQPNVNGKTLAAMAIPIPPLAEQQRIVAKVEELMAVCDELERSLDAVHTGRAMVLEAVLHEVLAEGGMEAKQALAGAQ